ncbi:hypothetical protein IEQ34_018359 [Dendrobium chrysotoxum]|uniref:Retrotransposon gag domain-containing protein n=1 Tax=Dendrobium chrysotoxum TaxID=161865 RepID=A0AAV7FW98_DENCH|nr:hypothetical protein IEQ34_018359 [Dendrobium chrysotoxum]
MGCTIHLRAPVVGPTIGEVLGRVEFPNQLRVYRCFSSMMQNIFVRHIQESRTIMQYEAEFTVLARYVIQLENTLKEYYYKFIRGSKTN